MAEPDLLTLPELCVVCDQRNTSTQSKQVQLQESCLSPYKDRLAPLNPRKDLVPSRFSLTQACRKYADSLVLAGGGFQAAHQDTRIWHLRTPEKWPQGLETASLEGTCDKHQAHKSLLACPSPPTPAGEGFQLQRLLQHPSQECPLLEKHSGAGGGTANSPPSSPLKVLLGVTKCIWARSLQQQGCLIKNELHFSSAHREN